MNDDEPSSGIQSLLSKMNPDEQRRFKLSTAAVLRYGEGAYKTAVDLLRENPGMAETDFWKEMAAAMKSK